MPPSVITGDVKAVCDQLPERECPRGGLRLCPNEPEGMCETAGLVDEVDIFPSPWGL